MGSPFAAYTVFGSRVIWVLKVKFLVSFYSIFFFFEKDFYSIF